MPVFSDAALLTFVSVYYIFLQHILGVSILWEVLGLPHYEPLSILFSVSSLLSSLVLRSWRRFGLFQAPGFVESTVATPWPCFWGLLLGWRSPQTSFHAHCPIQYLQWGLLISDASSANNSILSSDVTSTRASHASCLEIGVMTLLRYPGPLTSSRLCADRLWRSTFVLPTIFFTSTFGVGSGALSSSFITTLSTGSISSIYVVPFIGCVWVISSSVAFPPLDEA